MPADTTRATPTRRTQRKLTEEELKDIEVKRIRGELSCAECRRLKLRCDKKVPCSSCCRRGCESICPCGILSAGQGTRFILADTEQLHRKIADMSHRIRQLEDALAILYAATSDQRHPLLQDELLKIKFGAEALGSSQTNSANEGDAKPSIDALGTLTLGQSGEVKYFGRSAGSETLMMAGEEWDMLSDDEDEQVRIALSPELENLANLFPFTAKNKPNASSLEMLEAFLPTHERAWSLCDSYLDHATFFFRPIKRDELLNTFLPSIYNTANAHIRSRINNDPHPGLDESDEPAPIDSNSPHALATVFFVFALGALLDLNLPPYNTEAERYYDLGRAALSSRAVFDSPQIDTVQAMGLMATYHSLAGKKYSRDSAWCLMSFAAKLAQSIGLHRDSARWDMDPKTVQKRRTLFWEVFGADVSHSLALGRPPAIHLSYVDCEFPTDEEATLSDTGETQIGFWRMKYIFARDMFLAVAEATLTATSPSYNTVLNLDRKVRELSLPTSFKPYALREDGEKEFFSSSLSLRGFYASQYRTVTMIYLHRSFFAQAMLDHPTNPILSPFAPSFLTAYRCASVIIKAAAHQFDRCAEMAMRVWFLLYHTFSAAVIVGTVVTRSPNSNIALSALRDLGQAIELFERTALQSQRARIALGVLRKLKEKADRSYAQYCSSTLPASYTDTDNNLGNIFSPPFGIMSDRPQDYFDDELAIFGGQTRVLSRRLRNNKTSPTSVAMDSPSPPLEGPVSLLTVQDKVESSQSTITVPAMAGHRSFVDPFGPESGGYEQHPDSRWSTDPDVEIGQAQSTSVRATAQNTSQPSAIIPQDKAVSSLVGYSKNGSIPDAAAAPPSSSIADPYSLAQRGDRTAWNEELERNTHGLPSQMQDTTSIGWLPPLPPQSSYSYQPMASANSAATISRTYLASPVCPSSQDANFGSGALPGGPEYNSYELYSGAGCPDEGMAPADTTGAMVELGLMTESTIDARWFSLMQDCGIMDSTF